MQKISNCIFHVQFNFKQHPFSFFNSKRRSLYHVVAFYINSIFGFGGVAKKVLIKYLKSMHLKYLFFYFLKMESILKITLFFTKIPLHLVSMQFETTVSHYLLKCFSQDRLHLQKGNQRKNHYNSSRSISILFRKNIYIS